MMIDDLDDDCDDSPFCECGVEFDDEEIASGSCKCCGGWLDIGLSEYEELWRDDYRDRARGFRP